jgi:hypothetical protein
VLTPESMTAPIDQTQVYPGIELHAQTEDVRSAIQHADLFLQHTSQLLSESLQLGPVTQALVHSSSYTVAVNYEPLSGQLQRALLSPEEMSIPMTLQLLEEAGHE